MVINDDPTLPDALAQAEGRPVSQDGYHPYGALYLHIPFCAERCNYCDFITRAIDPADVEIDRYVERLIRDIREASRCGMLGSIETVYIGGGTPTFIGHKRLVSLIYTLSLSLSLHPETEFTVEANPESLTLPMVKDLFSLGVTRMSIGVQSFDDKELMTLGRIHDSAAARSAIETAQKRFENVSIDLMCGIPGQSLQSVKKDMDTAMDAGVTHISLYPLTVESETEFGRQLGRGLIQKPDEDHQADMMEAAARMLSQRDYERYEVASYALPGFICRHNIAYWTGVPYLGLGSGAAGMRENATVRERLVGGEVIERLSPAEAAIEDLMLGMRMGKGIDSGLLARAACDRPQIIDTFSELEVLGLIEKKGGRYIPTRHGWLLGNDLYARIWECA